MPGDFPARAHGALELAYGPTRLAAGVGIWFAAAQHPQAYPSALLESRAWSAGLQLLQDLVRAPVLLSPLLAVEYGHATFATSEVATPAHQDATWWAAGAGVRIGYELLPHLWSQFEGCALWPASRTRWVFRAPQGDVALYTSAPLMLRLSAGFSYVFE